MVCGNGLDIKGLKLHAANLDKTHVNQLKVEADKHCRLLDMRKQVAPRMLLQSPCSQAATQPAAASEPGPSTTPPAKRSKRTKAEQAAEPTKGKAKPAPHQS
ncbi:hypothetical protein QJQ45_015600 [Haematococcus lacustris]|nr:hypothetical protein QJQ45_015600 [Haematococcus lacustris]